MVRPTQGQLAQGAEILRKQFGPRPTGETPRGYRLVPIEPPTALAPLLIGYSLDDRGLSADDCKLLEGRLRDRWRAILEAIPDGVRVDGEGQQ